MIDSKKHMDNPEITAKENLNVQKPIKQLYHLNGKYFIVLDESIIDELKLLDDTNYFFQEATADGRIILQLVGYEDEVK